MAENERKESLMGRARDVKNEVDDITKDYIGFTIEELIRMALTGRRSEDEKRD